MHHEAPKTISLERRIPENRGAQQIFGNTSALDRRRRIHIFAVMTAKPTHDAPGATSPASADEPQRDHGARELSPAAKRALAEAEARRAEIDRKASNQPEEVNGRGGPDPARYGDWEVKGIASDF
jgi:hypothetical protein